jgi:hypothetical protein
LLETFVVDFLLLTDDILKSLFGCTTDSGVVSGAGAGEVVSGAGAGAGAGEVMILAGAFFADFDEDFLDDDLDDVLLADVFDGFGGFADELTERFDEEGFTEDDGGLKDDLRWE